MCERPSQITTQDAEEWAELITSSTSKHCSMGWPALVDRATEAALKSATQHTTIPSDTKHSAHGHYKVSSLS